jgi:hypothetical protein
VWAGSSRIGTLSAAQWALRGSIVLAAAGMMMIAFGLATLGRVQF